MIHLHAMRVFFHDFLTENDAPAGNVSGAPSRRSYDLCLECQDPAVLPKEPSEPSDAVLLEQCLSKNPSHIFGRPHLLVGLAGEPVMTEASIARVQAVVAEKGTDAWWQLPLEELLPPELRDQAPRLKKGEDTMVSFSVSTSLHVLLTDVALPLEELQDQGVSSQNGDDAIVQGTKIFRTSFTGARGPAGPRAAAPGRPIQNGRGLHGEDSPQCTCENEPSQKTFCGFKSVSIKQMDVCLCWVLLLRQQQQQQQ